MTQEVETLREQLTSLQENYNEAHEKVLELTKENGQLEVEVKALEETRDKLKDQVRELESSLVESQNEAEEAKADRDELQRREKQETHILPMDTLYIGLEKGNLIYQQHVDKLIETLRHV